MMAKYKKCSMPDCNKKAIAKTLCHSHYYAMLAKAKKRITLSKNERERKCEICGKEISLSEHLMAKTCIEHRKFGSVYKKRFIKRGKIIEKLQKERQKKLEKITNRYKTTYNLANRKKFNRCCLFCNKRFKTKKRFLWLCASCVELRNEVLEDRSTLAKKISGEIVFSSNPGKTIKNWRKRFKITQKELSDSLNITNSVISDYESGRRKSPGVSIIKKTVDSLLDIYSEKIKTITKQYFAKN